MDTEQTSLEKWADGIVQEATDGLSFGDKAEIASALRVLADSFDPSGVWPPAAGMREAVREAIARAGP